MSRLKRAQWSVFLVKWFVEAGGCGLKESPLSSQSMRSVCSSMSIPPPLLRAGAESRGGGSRANTLGSHPTQVPYRDSSKGQMLFLNKTSFELGSSH